MMTLRSRLTLAAAAAALLAAAPNARADVKLPAVFGSHMVLQRDAEDKVWGTADPGEEVTVTIADQTKTATAGDDGAWSLKLDPLPAGGPHTLTVAGKNTITYEDVLVGEVWICSGQSNMQWGVGGAYDADLTLMTARYPNLRLINVPQVGTQEPQFSFNGEWAAATSPEAVARFSAVGYDFGRILHEALDVPVGLINDAWGGSAAEAWVRRDLLEKDETYNDLMTSWQEREKRYDEAEEGSDTRKQLEGQMRGNARPGNIYNGVLKPTIGYGIRGVIWYQGETNAGRAYQYRDLFPLMIQSWRDEWGIGDFPFYWVQLADFMAEKTEPTESAWAELREAQTMTQEKLPKTGQAVIIDIGEGRDIHPRNKLDVAKRLARLALADVYGKDITARSPQFKSMEVKDGKAVITFDHAGPGGLYAFDKQELDGFTIAGEDREFHNAQARVVAPDKVEVWSDEVKEPVAVRYGWADNPIVNLYNRTGLPATPFRTDDWPGVTVNNTR